MWFGVGSTQTNRSHEHNTMADETNRSDRRQLKKANAKNENDEGKKFDKKKYRLQKYSNKYKVNQWEERRKKAILRDYYKGLDKDQYRSTKEQFLQKQVNQNENATQKQTQKPSAFHRAKQELLRKKDEKRQRKEEALKIKSERKEALSKYKEKKMQTFKKLSKKTKKGQPVMKDRLEMLLDKIQAQM